YSLVLRPIVLWSWGPHSANGGSFAWADDYRPNRTCGFAASGSRRRLTHLAFQGLESRSFHFQVILPRSQQRKPVKAGGARFSLQYCCVISVGIYTNGCYGRACCTDTSGASVAVPKSTW